MKITVLFILSALSVFVQCGPAPELFYCKSGQEFIENDCNHCYCLKDSELVCRISKCPQNNDKQLEKCRTGTAWWRNCNKCWCVNVGTVCTNNVCYSNSNH